MRNGLKNIGSGNYCTFSGIVVTYGKRNEKHVSKHKNYNCVKQTILLRDIRDKNKKFITGHVWIIMTEQLQRLGLRAGDIISFTAKVTEYVKGYWGNNPELYAPLQLDYGLTNISNVKLRYHPKSLTCDNAKQKG